MADNTPQPKEAQQPQQAKPAWLKEVEEDANYITQKRMDEHQEELKRTADKAKRDEGKK